MSATYGFADFEVDLEDGTLRRRGYTVPLQDQPFRLLALLLERAGTVVTREEIQTHLWPENTYVEFDKSLRVAVSKLREALRDSPTEPVYIETLPRRGYRFIAPVTDLTPFVAIQAATGIPDTRTSTDLPGFASGPAIEEPRQSQESQPMAILPWWRKPAFRVSLVAIAAGICIVIPAYLIRARLKNVLAPSVAAHPVVRRSVAVIGLRNLSDAAEDRWLSTALAEMLSTELSASDQLRVISGEEVARAGLAAPLANTPSHETLTRFGNQLGADMILLGSYTVTHEKGSSAPKMRLDLRLESITSDVSPVTLVETGAATDLFTLVSSSGKELRQQFGLSDVSPEGMNAVRRTLPTDPTAAQLYAEGLARLRNFDLVEARRLLQKAADIEPSHARTHHALSETLHGMGYESEASAEAARAVEFGAGLPRQELLTMQGQLALLRGEGAAASTIFRSLLTFYPDNISYAIHLEQAQILESKFPDAVATMEGMRQKGLSRADQARIDLTEAIAYLQTGDFRKSVATADRAIQAGTDLDIKFLRSQGLWVKASALERLGDSQGSLAASSEAQSMYRTMGDKRGLGLALLMSGDVLYDKGQTADARQDFLESLELFRAIDYRSNMGIVEERIGNTFLAEGALADSRKYYQQALASYREIHWDGGVASAIGNIANVQDAEGDIPGSLESNRQGLDLFEKAGDKRGVASTLANMGNLELERGTLDQAAIDYNRAAEMDRQIDYARGLAFALTGQGDVLTARNDLPGALHQYQLAQKAVEGMDEPAVLAPLKVSLGIATLESGNATQAAAYLQQGADIAIKDQNHSVAGYALAYLSRALLAQGRIADASTTANKAVAESRLQFSPQMRLIPSLALARVLVAQGNITAAKDEIRSITPVANQHGYAPLALESRILLAHSESSSGERRRQLDALAGEASAKGWKLLAAQAHKP